MGEKEPNGRKPTMKEIKAYCRPERVEAVVRALREAGLPHLTIVHVRSLGERVALERAPISVEAGAHYVEHAKLELVCSGADVERAVALIREEARTGAPGDGIIFVSPVEGAIKIRTGVEGRDALV